MDLEMGLVSSWNSSSSSPSFSSASSSPSRSSSSSVVVAVADRIELEAAEALADLAHSAKRESCGGDSGSQWGCKGKRAKKRVKSESPAADSFSDAAPPRLSTVSSVNFFSFAFLC
uniref:Uncharacterized protein n=1 Tax=Rhizophora mucronata TaxID=61149 RepID=A0A2P2JJ32_RHIMU